MSFVPGTAAAVRRTIAESDVWLFAGVANDYYGVHVDAQYARGTRFGRPIAHGAYSIGLVSAAASALAQACGEPTAFAVGFEVKFLGPVFPGDTVAAAVRVAAEQPEPGAVRCEAEVTNQDGTRVLSGQIWLRRPGEGS